MKRTVTSELLENDAGTAEEIAASLADLRRINRWFGGTRVVRALAREVARRGKLRDMTLLDVAGASGDISAAVQKSLAREGVRVRPLILDRAATHLPPSRAPGATGVVALQGDALALPFRDASVDVVTASLLVHELEPPAVKQFVGEALRVCRQAVILNDLRRSRLHLALVYAGFPLFRSRLTRHDGPASVRRAYTLAELRAMLGPRAELRRFYLCRVGVILWK